MEHLRDKLSRRLRVLMHTTPALSTQTKVSKKAKVSQSTVQRILSRDVSATVDVVEDLGRAFGFKPPSLILSDEAEAEMLKAWLVLNQVDREQVQRYALDLAFKPQAEKPRLRFEVKLEAAPAKQAANMRASSRAPRHTDLKEQCLPPGKKSSSQTPASSSPSPARKLRTRSA